MEVKLYVGNLAYSTTEQELQLLFAQAGSVTSVNLMQDQKSGQSKGFAFVTMDTQAEAQKAVARFNTFILSGRALRVTIAKLDPPASGRMQKEIMAKPDPSTSGYQSHLSAFTHAGQEQSKAKPTQPRAAPGGYQSRLSAFGPGSHPTEPRRRGRNQ